VTATNLDFVGGGLGFEIGYNVLEHVQIGFAYSIQNLPAIDEPLPGGSERGNAAYRAGTSEARHFFGIRTRFVGYATRPTTPYLHVGAQAFGGKRDGVTRFGVYPHVGLGLEHSFDALNALFFEGNFGGLIPDEAADALNDRSGNIDFFTTLAAGYTRRFGPATTPVDILRVEGPLTAQTGESVVYTASVNLDEATGPLDYRWDFGDGTVRNGLVARHTFTAPGSYPVTFTAVGPGNVASEEMVTFVAAPVPEPTIIEPITSPVIIALAFADPSVAAVGAPVRFGAEVEGDEPFSCRWSFGDGFETSACEPIYSYRAPGTYTATLEVANATGGDLATVEVVVEDAVMMTPEIAQLDACADVSELETVFFSHESSALTPDAMRRLNDNVDVLASCPTLTFQVDGYAGPTEMEARPLSEARAAAVASYYAARGLALDRMIVQGRGRVIGISRKQAGMRYQYATTVLFR
jgi:PKD repeat protein